MEYMRLNMEDVKKVGNQPIIFSIPQYLKK